MTEVRNKISQEDARFYLDLLLEFSAVLFERYAFLILWQIRDWPYSSISDDYFEWPCFESVHDVSFLEELVAVLHTHDGELFEYAYRSHLSQACRSIISMIDYPEDRIMVLSTCQDLDRVTSRSEDERLIEQRLTDEVISIARRLDIEDIRESWANYRISSDAES